MDLPKGKRRLRIDPIIAAAGAVIAAISVIAFILSGHIGTVNQSVIAGDRAIQTQISDVHEELRDVRNDVQATAEEARNDVKAVADEVSDLREDIGYIKGRMDASQPP